jgi:hypothetical protein
VKNADYQAEHGQILPPREQHPVVHVEEEAAQRDVENNELGDLDEQQSYDREAFRKQFFPRGVSFSGPRNARQKAVVGSFLHAWRGYKKFAW